ncbi:MAG: polysaccharide pyruvyl transferase family protein [Patescibacteria group bacterium]|nr:polysaccharide pyruvyl transferase family protein [Patescibacteria group bacterium]
MKTDLSFIILHAHNTLNNGSFMMLINTIWNIEQQTKKINKTVSYFVELNTPQDLERLKQELPGIDSLHALPITQKKELKSNKDLYVNFFIENGIQVVQILMFLFQKKLNGMIILGGDDLSEYYASWRIIFRLVWIYLYSLLTKVFIIGQTIGPFYSWRKASATILLKNIDIFVRDSISFKYSKEELYLTQVRQFSDLAFMPLPEEKKNEKFFRKYGLEKKRYITIVPSGIPQHYTKNEKHYIDNWIELVRLLTNEYKGIKLVLMAHVYGPPVADDRRIIEKNSGFIRR